MNLHYGDLPSFDGLKELSKKINLSERTLRNIKRNPDIYYKKVEIPKKNGTSRILACPSTTVKAIQAWILRNILDKLPAEKSATGFVRGSGIKANVLRHVGNEYFLCMDLENFFPSIKFGTVYAFYQSLGYNKHSSYFLSAFCCFEGGLPQGGVTSPALSNLISSSLDKKLMEYCRARQIIYTRYADDLTFSASNLKVLKQALAEVTQIIMSCGFDVNNDKTRFLRPGVSRKITGLVYSETQSIGIGKQKRKQLRAMIHELEFRTFIKEDYEDKLRVINGWRAFLSDVDTKSLLLLDNYWKRLKEKKQLALGLIQDVAASDEATDD